MKMHGSTCLNYSLSMLGILIVLTGSESYAGAMGPVAVNPGKIYLGVFGGAGASTTTEISQYGTAFDREINGGPLAVNGFGETNSRTVGLIGGHIGYQWSELLANPLNMRWGLVPAIELEGYYLGKSSYKGRDLSNDTVRLVEHDFLATYPMNIGVFLTNAVLNFNLPNYSRFHPYVGGGIGASVISINEATAFQLAPPEPGINHYNSNPSDTEATFAAQAKLGLNFDLSTHTSLFVEYRWLYMPSSNYIFGSTVFPGHLATSNWLVKIDAQNYNTGAIGIQYSV